MTRLMRAILVALLIGLVGACGGILIYAFVELAAGIWIAHPMVVAVWCGLVVVLIGINFVLEW